MDRIQSDFAYVGYLKDFYNTSVLHALAWLANTAFAVRPAGSWEDKF